MLSHRRGYRSDARRSTRARVVAGVVAVLAVPVAANATESQVLLGEPPSSAADVNLLARALGSLDGTVAHRMRIDGKVGARIRQPRSTLGVTITDDFAALIQVATPQRASLSLADGIFGQLMSAIAFDGRSYAGAIGIPYVKLVDREAQAVAEWIEPEHQVIRPDDLSHLSEIRTIPTSGADAGLVHFRAVLDSGYARAVTGAIVAPAGRPGRDLAASLTYPEGRLDVFTTTSGELVRERVSVSAGFDGGLSGRTWSLAGIPVGTAKLSVSATFTPSDLGAPIEVTEPYVPKPDPGMDDDFNAIMLLSAGADAVDTYGKVVGDYSGLTVRALRRIEPNIEWVTGRVARSSRYEVRLGTVEPKRVTLSTRTPALRTFILRLQVNGDVALTCRNRHGKPCEMSFFAKMVTRTASTAVPRVVRRLHAAARASR